jgi:ABC-type multidrug transport system fused ATPase/permease subunit
MAPIDEKVYLEFGWRKMLSALVGLLGEQKKHYLLLSLVLTGVLFYELVPPFLVGKMVDFFGHYHRGDSLTLFYIYIGVLAVSGCGVAFLRLATKYRLYQITAEVTYRIRVKGFDALLEKSLRWHDGENTGNKVQRIQNGASTISLFQDLVGNEVGVQLTAASGVLIAFAFMSWPLLILCLIYVGIFYFIQRSFYHQIQEMDNEFNIRQEKASGTYVEGLGNMMTIKALGAKKSFSKNVASQEERSRDQMIKITKVGNNKWKFFNYCNFTFLALALLFIGHQFIHGAISIGSVFIFYTYFSRLQAATVAWTHIFDRLVSYKNAIARLMPMLDHEEGILSGNKSFPLNWKEIEIKEGSFHYSETPLEGETAALESINLTIPRGQKLGIVGRSGSGKSTLAKLLVGLYHLDQGEYLIGKTEFSHIIHEEALGHIGLVLQDSEMFNLRFQDNITLMRTFDAERFAQAMEIAQLVPLLEDLPDGLETLIGEKGYRLSGGERQRIGVARAIYKNPDILILDEATSSLDTKTERLIQEGLDSLSEKTVISIAHRISTLETTDLIIVMKDGSIVEEGSFKELLANKDSIFRDIHQHTPSS